MSWMERIAEQETREDARAVFDEWLEMKADLNENVTFVERTGDVGVLHVAAGEPATPNVDDHTARDICAQFARGRNPVRCIDITGVERGVVQLNMLLAELRVDDPCEEDEDENTDATCPECGGLIEELCYAGEDLPVQLRCKNCGEVELTGGETDA